MTYSYGPPSPTPTFSVAPPAPAPSLTVGVPTPGPALAAIPDTTAVVQYVFGGPEVMAYTGNEILVAASDAPGALKTVADYTCNGTDDDVTIEQALADYGKIRLSLGTFNCSQEIDLNVDDQWIEGMGYGTVVNVSAGTATDQDTFQIAADRCRISNLRTTGGAGIGRNAFKVGAGADDVQLFNLHIDTPNQHGIGATGASGSLINRLSIQNVYVTGAGAGGSAGQGVVLSEYTADCAVDRLWATACLESGLHTFDNSAGTHATRHQFSNIFTWSNTVHGISIQDVDECSLTNFVTHSNGTHGLRFNLATYCNVSNGVSRANGDDGLNTNSSSTYLNVTNVTCEGNTDNGYDIASPSTLFTNCRSIGHTGSGDRGFSFSGTATNCQMVNCIADGNDNNLFTNVSATGIQMFGGALINAVSTNVTDNAGSVIRAVQGYATDGSGTGSIASGGTTDVITHGLDITPTIDDIIITLAENPTNTPGAIWVDTIGSTTFTVNCENDPGASNLDFGWRVVT